MTAGRFGSQTVLDALIAAGSDVHAEDHEGRNALILAVCYCTGEKEHAFDLADLMYRTRSTQFIPTEQDHFTPGSDLGTIAGLIRAGLNVDDKDIYHRTALMYAAQNNDICILKALITECVDVDAVDADGNTALMYAAKCARPEALTAFVEAGAEVHTMNTYGDSAITFATSSGDDEKVNILLTAGA